MKTSPEIQTRIMSEFGKSGAEPRAFLSPEFMQTLNTSLERQDQERYQEAVSTLFEAGLVNISGTTLELTQRGWEYLHSPIS